MLVQQFFINGIAHSSYLLGGSDTCAIVDPSRDVDVYIEAAKALGMEITHILETHLHADFISGHMDLAEQTGARIYAPKSGQCRFDHVALEEGDEFEIEDLKLSVLDTGGHTPEHISYVVRDRARGEEPVGVFCGDTLFVGDVGRPDLFPGKARELASRLFDNLHGKLLKLPDFCEVYPAHGAGSLCGRAMGAKRTSTIGYERKYNAALQIRDKEEFITSLTTGMPDAPDHFARCSAMNAAGPALLRALPKLEPLDPGDFARHARRAGVQVLDIRRYDAFGGQHVPGAWHIDLGGNFATFAGWVLPVDAEILLVSDTEQRARDAVVWLRRVGLDKVTGYLNGGMFAWARAGLPTEHVAQLSAHELHEMACSTEPMTLVDVRSPAEFEALHIEGAVNIPAPDLRTRHSELPKDAPIALTCSTGHRSSLAASILLRNGHKGLRNVAGGMSGYNAAGYAGECPMCVVPHGPHFTGR
ncbi:MAG: MBL fold metallo-hydrolase [Candidatus Brocadiaceae bacterium]|nr:MBL fold metallo-hydrolase [Candidatus Brocadiaceae bacterium]